MSYKITLSTEDNKQFEFTSNAEQTVQEAAEASHLYPPFGCKSGSCGACLGTCTSGDYQQDSYNEDALPQELSDAGGVLLCRTHAQSDLQISLPYNADCIQQTLAAPRLAEIISLETIAARTLKVVLQLQDDPDLGLAFEFPAGQFVELEVPETKLMRAYSLANNANWEGRLEFLIRLQPQGKFSDFIQQAQVGQSLLVHPASGAFVLNQQSANPRCFIAGGTGLAPFLSMLTRMAEWGEDHPTHLFLGVNNEAEILCQEQLATLQQALPQLSVEICVWKPEDNWQGFVGTPVDAFQAHLDKNGTDTDVYLCGPPILVESATKAAIKAGIQTSHIHSEKFT